MDFLMAISCQYYVFVVVLCMFSKIGYWWKPYGILLSKKFQTSNLCSVHTSFNSPSTIALPLPLTSHLLSLSPLLQRGVLEFWNNLLSHDKPNNKTIKYIPHMFQKVWPWFSVLFWFLGFRKKTSLYAPVTEFTLHPSNAQLPIGGKMLI